VNQGNPLINALTFDVEEYFQVSAFENDISRDDWHRLPSRVEASVHVLLDLLEEHAAKATFFTLGCVAEQHPALVSEIVARGHEVGCHGFEHVRVYKQTPAEFRADIERAKKILEDCTGNGVRGYRAASFSIRRSDFWAFDEMAEAGFEYSSSVYPVQRDHYGIPDAPRHPFRPASEHPALVEVPISTLRFNGRNFPIGGGGFFRLYPYAVSRFLIRRANVQENMRVNMYFHPWEFDPGQPRMSKLPAKTRFRHYLNLDRTVGRLRQLLKDFRWSTMAEVYAEDLLREPNEGQVNVR
tara:strand:+ start:799 stop:1689 length:891 start_codon:yes stop_codon:yes gene_type:complete